MNAKTRAGFARAKQAGRDAARAGKLPSDNPFKPSACGNRHWWESGWWEAENQMALEQSRPVRRIDGGITLIGANIVRQKLWEKQS